MCSGQTLEHASSGAYTAGVRKVDGASLGNENLLVYELRADPSAVMDCRDALRSAGLAYDSLRYLLARSGLDPMRFFSRGTSRFE